MLGPLPAAGQVVLVSRTIGYAPRVDTITLPQSPGDTARFTLEAVEHEEEEVIVTSTRSSRTISDIPTRIEVIAGEELDEKANMKPGDIRMVLNESTGIMTQQTSATSANASIRIQGLDGRYTQILKDGMPLYGGFSSGLSLLQTPPLDLKQIEVVKGAASTLYGGGAIAGLVNLISRSPGEKPQTRVLLNGTTAGGLDVNFFRSARHGKVGYTVNGARNSNFAYDPSGTGLSAIPRFTRYTLAPRLYLYPDSITTIWLGINASTENRLGGDIRYADGARDTSLYFEGNQSDRISGQFSVERHFSKHLTGRVKSSLNRFSRRTTEPGYLFSGLQTSSFGEVSLLADVGKTEWIGGLNAWTDRFAERGNPSEKLDTTLSPRSYERLTFGAFLQNTYSPVTWLTLETGLRTDHVRDFGWAVLPRVSLLLKLPAGFTSRIGGGLGYKTPDIFTEEAERRLYRGVAPVSTQTNKIERSFGAQADVNYAHEWLDGELTLSLNQLVFSTQLQNPLLLTTYSSGAAQLQNIDGYISTRGAETNARLKFEPFMLYFGYTLTRTDVHRNNQPTRENYLTPRHRINAVLFYEIESKWKIGLEAYYNSSQKLSDGATGKPYWICGFMAERLFKHFSLYINCEDFLDVRQSRIDTFFSGSRQSPIFRDIYAPLDGVVVNGGLKINL